MVKFIPTVPVVWAINLAVSIGDQNSGLETRRTSRIGGGSLLIPESDPTIEFLMFYFIPFLDAFPQEILAHPVFDQLF